MSLSAERQSRARPRFDYKLRWFDRLAKHAENLLATGEPVVLAGDYNVMRRSCVPSSSAPISREYPAGWSRRF
jgi:exonuclease III